MRNIISTFYPFRNTSISLNFLSSRFHKTISSMQNSVLAICQLNSTPNKADNFQIIRRFIQVAKEQHAKMVFFPEACDYVCNREDVIKLSEPLNGEFVTNVQALAKEYGIIISFGIHEYVSADKVFNCHIIIDEYGRVIGIYRKMHTFDAQISQDVTFNESSFTKRGDAEVTVVKTSVGNIGLAICYDLRFPELGAALRSKGADILTYPSAFTYETGCKHWETLLRCRAIENQCYVIAAAQTGRHDIPQATRERVSWGHSMIIDPDGNICARIPQGTGIAIAEINKQFLEKIRLAMPLLHQKRFNIFPKNEMKENAKSGSFSTSYKFGLLNIDGRMVFYETTFCIAFVNIRCVVPGHVLVIPKTACDRFEQLTASQVSDLFLTVQKVQTVMESVHGVNSSTLVIQDGPEAGQTIKHVHVHVMPRKKGDFVDNDDIYRTLEKHDKPNFAPERRSDEEMIAEATYLRTFFFLQSIENNAK